MSKCKAKLNTDNMTEEDKKAELTCDYNNFEVCERKCDGLELGFTLEQYICKFMLYDMCFHIWYNF